MINSTQPQRPNVSFFIFAPFLQKLSLTQKQICEEQMVGLSVVLESHKTGGGASKKTVLPLFILNKATMMIKPAPLTPPQDFLHSCLLCRQKLLPGKDIYMYKGDRAYCSEECRWKQIVMEEEEEDNSYLSRRKKKERKGNSNCSLTHRRATTTPPNPGGFAR